MKRRDAIHNIFIVGGAMWLFPKCAGEPTNATTAFLKESQKRVLTELTEAIIPATADPGARELGVQHFVEKMVSDCRNPDYQTAFKSGLEKWEDFTKSKTGKSWAQLKSEEKQALLTQGMSDQQIDQDIQTCIKGTRELTITGYRNSKYYLTTIQEYRLVAGHFNGCVAINSKNN